MPTTPTTAPRDPALEAHLFWHNNKQAIIGAIFLGVLALVGMAGYRYFAAHREAAATDLLANAKSASDYEQVIKDYPHAPAAASAYLLLAQGQRDAGKFTESNATLQTFIDKNPDHELASSAAVGIAANLQSMGKKDEALAAYQQVAAKYSSSFNAPLALFAQVELLKAKKQEDAARRVCETILSQYRDSMWASQAMRELSTMKPPAPPAGAPMPAIPPNAGAKIPPAIARPPGGVPVPVPAAPVPSGASPAKPK